MNYDSYITNGYSIKIYELLFSNKKLEDIFLYDLNFETRDSLNYNVIAATIPENKREIKILKNNFGMDNTLLSKARFYGTFPKNNSTAFENFYDQNI